MSKAIDNLIEAMKAAEAIRPRVGGFPYLAEVLRKAGVTRNVWSLPSGQSLFLTQEGPGRHARRTLGDWSSRFTSF